MRIIYKHYGGVDKLLNELGQDKKSTIRVIEHNVIIKSPQVQKNQADLLELIHVKEKAWTDKLDKMHDIETEANSIRAEIQQYYKQFSDESEWSKDGV